MSKKAKKTATDMVKDMFMKELMKEVRREVRSGIRYVRNKVVKKTKQAIKDQQEKSKWDKLAQPIDNVKGEIGPKTKRQENG